MNIDKEMIAKLKEGLKNLERLEKYAGDDGILRLEGSPDIDVGQMKKEFQKQLDALEKKENRK